MNRPYCIAEIGGNHEGDFAKALDLVKLAKGPININLREQNQKK